jgi:aromatic ring-opening dioxygenase catalytic subunit (LigB family)
MAISFQSDEEVLRKLQERLRKMSDQELIKLGRDVARVQFDGLRISSAHWLQNVLLTVKRNVVAGSK